MAAPLFTIGYEKATPDAVLAELKKARVSLLVDTRAVTSSRRPGFSKKQLAAALDDNGIAYLHLQKLGTPAEGRRAARKGDVKTLRRIYNHHLKSSEARAAMDELLALLRGKQRVCLLCYERAPETCHRSRIAEIVQQKVGVTIKDLFPALF
jgi:uncharacterized protein (DUF488 family)